MDEVRKQEVLLLHRPGEGGTREFRPPLSPMQSHKETDSVARDFPGKRLGMVFQLFPNPFTDFTSVTH